LTAPIIDYEPPPQRVTQCPPPTPAALRRRHPRPLRPHRVVEPAPSREAAVFADAALRRVLEVIDRRRPIGQLRAMLAPPLVDSVTALARRPHTAAANLCRVRLRCVEDGAQSAEVFATYTRGGRVHAIAAKIARIDGTHRWRVEALQIG
jgi:hypothetical protein